MENQRSPLKNSKTIRDPYLGLGLSIQSHNIQTIWWLNPFKDVGWFSVDSLWELTPHELSVLPDF